MSWIILELYEDGKPRLMIHPDHLNEPAMNNGVPSGKTHLELIKDDILNGTNKSGHAKYRKILKEHNVIDEAELITWRMKLSIKESDIPVLDSV